MLGRCALFRWGQEAARAQRRQLRQGQVARHAEAEQHALTRAILAQQTHTLSKALPRRGRAGYRVDANVAATYRIQPKNRPQQLGAAGTDQPRHAEHFSAVELE
jgi:hypothetical protein